MSYKTPNVYVEEVPVLPPSVAQVSTAVPAFIGYTEKVQSEGVDLVNKPVKISTFLEYRTIFGGPQAVTFEVAATETKDGNNVVTDTTIDSVTKTGALTRFMYHCIDMYFRNGGGSCYVVSVGDYNAAIEVGDDQSGILGGLKAAELKDEPTLILIPDAVNLVNQSNVQNAVNEDAVNAATANYYTVCQAILSQCAKLKDRFAIFDVLNLNSDHSTDEANFRNGIGSNNLKYGAAYYPNVKTSLTYDYRENEVSITGLSNAQLKQYLQANCIKVTYNGVAITPKVKILVGTEAPIDFEVNISDPDVPVLSILNVKVDADNKHTGAEIATAWQTWAANNDPKGYTIEADGDANAQVTNILATALEAGNNPSTLISIKDSNTGAYNKIKAELNNQWITLPPSAAIAGIYAAIDRNQGVWKAPANVSLAAVIAPVIKISDDEQENLNVHVEGGKSINAIRSFAGKGSLVWGARTLAGNDNEWRFISVRRLFNMIEESTQKATRFAVFEANTESTWIKVKAMISNYLTGLWQEGAIVGSTPEAAFFVKVGLGETMTQQDILEGKMNIEIGVAAARPAEFIILKFSHKLQES